MNEHPLGGIDGSQPLGFLAAVGALVATAATDPGARLAWPESLATTPVLVCRWTRTELVERLAADPRGPVSRWLDGWMYPKVEKKGPKEFRGCRAPVGVYRRWVEDAVDAADPDRLAAVAAIACPTPGKEIAAKDVPHPSVLTEFQVLYRGRLDVATHPTPFDLTVRNTQFLDQLRVIGGVVDAGAVTRQVFEGLPQQGGGIRRMGWDPWCGHPAALGGAGSSPAVPVLDWLAFRGLALLPMVPRLRGPRTASVSDGLGGAAFCWPLWAVGLDVAEVRTLLGFTLAEDWTPEARRARGIRELFRAKLTKAADGYATVFSPSSPI